MFGDSLLLGWVLAASILKAGRHLDLAQRSETIQWGIRNYDKYPCPMSGIEPGPSVTRNVIKSPRLMLRMTKSISCYQSLIK